MKHFDTKNRYLKFSEFDETQKLIRRFHEKYFDKSAKNKFNKKRNKNTILLDFLNKIFTHLSQLIVTFKTSREIAETI